MPEHDKKRASRRVALHDRDRNDDQHNIGTRDTAHAVIATPKPRSRHQIGGSRLRARANRDGVG